MENTRKTKIIATVGPACNSVETLTDLINAGTNVFRLNFSHGNHQDHIENIKNIRAASVVADTPVGILQDLSGPKLRITEVDPEKTFLERGQSVSLAFGEEVSTNEKIYTASINPTTIVSKDNLILMADGVIVLAVEEVASDHVVCKVTKGGDLRSKIGIAFPDSKINLPATTEKDLQDFEMGLEHGVDIVAISFVQEAQDILELRKRMEETERALRPLLISKIEMKSAIDNLDEILEVSDGIMVARGDLGVELPVEKLPSIQRQLIQKANATGKTVIVATQMLHSMVNSNRPTRAEVTDVSTAVRNGTDAVMLSEETAIGNYPVESVEYLDRIAQEAENDFNFEIFKLRFNTDDFSNSVPDAIAYASCAAAHRLNAAAIAACTETGFSAKLIAKYRPQQALYGVSSRPSSLRKMCLFWGVYPIHFDAPDDRGAEIDMALIKIQNLEKLSDDAIAIITGGLTVRVPGTTSVLEIRKFGSSHHE